MMGINLKCDGNQLILEIGGPHYFFGIEQADFFAL
jgi:hypothetical protein